MTALECITEWAELAKAATEGPLTPTEDWAAIAHGPDSVAHGYYRGYCPACGDFIEDDAFVAIDPADAALTAASRTAVPAMAAALTAVLERHPQIPVEMPSGRTYYSCSPCGHCGGGYCPTVAAIETALGVTP